MLIFNLTIRFSLKLNLLLSKMKYNRKNDEEVIVGEYQGNLMEKGLG